MGLTQDSFVRGQQFDGLTGLKSAEQLEDLVTRATPSEDSELIDQDTLETYLDEDLGVYRLRVKPGSSAGIPPGALMSFALSTPPTGWLECDGSLVLIADYPDLYAAIGTTYGSGTDAFGLPNCKGKVLVAYDSDESDFNTMGKTGGEKTHLLTASEMPAHTHSAPLKTSGGTDFGGSAPNVWGGNNGIATGSAGGGGAHNNLQPYIVMKWCIKT